MTSFDAMKAEQKKDWTTHYNLMVRYCEAMAWASEFYVLAQLACPDRKTPPDEDAIASYRDCARVYRGLAGEVDDG